LVFHSEAGDRSLVLVQKSRVSQKRRSSGARKKLRRRDRDKRPRRSRDGV
jgi:hypothetical protein